MIQKSVWPIELDIERRVILDHQARDLLGFAICHVFEALGIRKRKATDIGGLLVG